MKKVKNIVTVMVIVVGAWFAAWFLCGFMTGITNSRSHGQTMEETAIMIENDGETIQQRTYDVSFSNGETWQICRRYVLYDGYVYMIEWNNFHDLITFQNITSYTDIEA